MSLPTLTLRRTTLSTPSTLSPITQQTQIRHASLLRRPHRPYQFTQLITLSDGSTYTTRTTSPAPVYKSTKDTRNHLMWNPSLNSLRNIEDDEAGRLKAFRMKFGRGWDVDGGEEEDVDGEVIAAEGDGGEDVGSGEETRGGGSLMDLISEQYEDRGQGKEMTGKVEGAGKVVQRKGSKGGSKKKR